MGNEHVIPQIINKVNSAIKNKKKKKLSIKGSEINLELLYILMILQMP